MSDLLRLTAPIDLQAAADNSRKPATVTILAYSGQPFSPPGFPNVVIDLAGADVAGDIPLLAGHKEELDAICGQGAATIRDGKLFVDGVLTDATQAGEKVVALARAGIALQASVGYSPGERERIAPGQVVSVNGRRLTAGPAGLTIVRSGKLREVSLLPVGADASTQVTIAARSGTSEAGGNVMDELNNQATQNAEQLRAQCAAEATRVANVETVCARYAGDMDSAKVAAVRAQAIREGWDENRCELEFIRAGRPAGIGCGGYQSPSRDVLVAGWLLHMGQEAAAVGMGEKVVQQAHEMRAVHCGDLLRAGLALEGRQVPTGGLDGLIKAAFSSASLPGILSNAAGKILENAYQAVPSVAKLIAAKLSANDFKTHTGYRLTGDSVMKEVGADGELAHGTLDEQSFPYSVNTVGRIFGITRQMLKTTTWERSPRFPQCLAEVPPWRWIKRFGRWFLPIPERSSVPGIRTTSVVRQRISELLALGWQSRLYASKSTPTDIRLPFRPNSWLCRLNWKRPPIRSMRQPTS